MAGKPYKKFLMILILVFILVFIPSTPGNTDTLSSTVTHLNGFTLYQLTDNSFDNNYPALAVDFEGTVLVAYEEYASPAYGIDIAVATWNAVGGRDSYSLTGTNDQTGSTAVVDANGEFSIIYRFDDGSGEGDLFQAQYTGPGHIINYIPVTDNSDDDVWITTAADGWGNLHVAYMRGYITSTFDIYYATNSGGNWVNTPITNDPDFYWFPSIAVDAEGYAHVVYTRYGDLRYATNKGGTWQNSVLDPGPGVGKPSIAVDAGGDLHIVYHSHGKESGTGRDYRNVMYRYGKDGLWDIETVAGPLYETSIVDPENDIAVDYAGTPHIVYHNLEDGQVYFATRTQNGWLSRRISDNAATLPLNAGGKSLEIDPGGIAYVTYAGVDSASGDNEIYLAVSDKPVGPRWQIMDVGPSADPFFDWDTSLKLDYDMQPHISYYNAITGTLMYGWLDSGVMQTKVMTDGADVGMHNAIGVNFWKVAQFMFYDRDFAYLAYINNNGVSTPVDNLDGHFVGRYVAFVRSDSILRAAYYDETDGDLRFASTTNPNNPWSIEVIANEGDVGRFTALADNSGRISHVAYYDLSNQAVMYARNEGSGWVTRTVDSPITYWGYDWDISITADVYDNPRLSYYDTANAALKYAEWNGTSWKIETLDAMGDVGQFNSMALDSRDNPHIVYYDFTNGDLKYARRQGGQWFIQWVAKAGITGRYVWLDLDAFGFPHISYYDVTEQMVKYATLKKHQVYIPMIKR